MGPAKRSGAGAASLGIENRRSGDVGAISESFELTAPVTARAAPSGPSWIHEIRHDGLRCAAVIRGGSVRLLTRNRRDVAKRFHRIAAELLPLRRHDAIIDGEIGAQDESGVARFDNLHRAIEAGAYENLIYFAFDLLYVDGVDLRPQPLLSRKECLRDLLEPLKGTRIIYCDHLEGDPAPLYAYLCEIGAEGIVSKAAAAPYRGGRDPNWLNIKCRAWSAKRRQAAEQSSVMKRRK
jgi:bifunctional non-homologous end joining protein LigD